MKNEYELELRGKLEKEKVQNERSLNKIFFNEKNVHFQSNDSLN